MSCLAHGHVLVFSAHFRLVRLLSFPHFGPKMTNFSYAQVTAAAVDTLRKATIESAGKGEDENQTFFDIGRGVVRM